MDHIFYDLKLQSANQQSANQQYCSNHDPAIRIDRSALYDTRTRTTHFGQFTHPETARLDPVP